MFANQSFLTSAQIKAQMEALQAQLAQAEEIEKSSKKIIEEIKKSKIDPKALTALLVAEKLIILPAGSQSTDKELIFTTAVTTKEGRQSTFKVWKDREVWKLTADALKYWQSVKQLGQEKFIEKSNEVGKAWFATEAGKNWLAKAFA
ncbi:hypothetical protein [Delftia sp. JD2]|uniref:hypothetical protein n=1 Tax=Delftia sp. JD2 TaxID=469553 RepID=UPI001112C2F0|nr:hypothetical protein [Delftia sp. JD2]